MNSSKNTAILLVSCPDRKGIVASVADFLYKHNANILHADEHRDSEQSIFFLRVEWDLAGFDIEKEAFGREFEPVSKRFGMEWHVAYSEEKQKIAIFVSKEEHCLADLLFRYKSGELACEVGLIVSNYETAKPLADFYNVPFFI